MQQKKIEAINNETRSWSFLRDYCVMMWYFLSCYETRDNEKISEKEKKTSSEATILTLKAY